MLLVRLILRYPKICAALTAAAIVFTGIDNLKQSRPADSASINAGADYSEEPTIPGERDCPVEIVTFSATSGREQLRQTIEMVLAGGVLREDMVFDLVETDNSLQLSLAEPLSVGSVSDLIAPVVLNATGLERVSMTCSGGRVITL